VTSQPDDFFEDELQLENSEDIVVLDKESFSNAVVSSNDWTVETMIGQINKGNFSLNPNFQRRDAWDKNRKSKFIESLILGLPVPQIVLAESKDRRGSYIVLDGKQRLLSIRQFASSPGDPDYEQLKLSSLEIRDDLNGKTLTDLQGDISHFDDLSSFENQPVRTVVIKNWVSENFLFHVFLRLNTGSVPLSPQELRQALHPGPFLQFLDIKSSQSSALKQILKLKKPDFRMRDAELLLRYFAFKNYLSDYTGSLKSFLDGVCQDFNSNWSNMEHELHQQLSSFESAHNAITSIFGNNAYKKWSGSFYESRFNRAVFDILILSFSHEEVRTAALKNKPLIESEFQSLCSNNRQFLASIETTTKSLTATHTRISTWFSSVNSILGTNLSIPKLINGRIQ